MRTVSRTLIAICILTTSAFAQKRPDFSGSWVVTSPKDTAGQERLITQTAKSITIERVVAGGGSRKTTYELDGIERQVPVPRQPDIKMMVKASWEASTIVVITNIAYPEGRKTQSKDVWSIDAKGQLVIDTTERGPNGAEAPVEKLVLTKKK